MKVDLYNNYQTFIQEFKQDSLINRWYRDLGLTAKSIEKHPCIADLSILINIRNNYWNLMTSNERGLWTGCWGIVFKNKKFLRARTLTRFEELIPKMIDREKLLQEQRQRIQSLRLSNTEPLKRDHNNEAKGSHLPSLHKQTGANKSAGECPYF